MTQGRKHSVWTQILRLLVVTTGFVTLASSMWGLYVSYQSLARAFAGDFTVLNEQYHVPYFYACFYPMLSVTVGCCLVLGWCGIDQIRAKVQYLRAFIFLLIFEAIYVVLLAAVLWRFPAIQTSIGAASGVANQGLYPQAYFVLPVWAPVILWWVKKNRNALALSEIAR